MQELLKTHFGYDAFRPLQADIIRTVLEKQDALVLMPTGGGKSLCYQLPALVFDGITIVISPLIALMKDQVDTLVANGIAAAFLNSTLNAEEIRSVESRALLGELKILYLAPERLSSMGFSSFLQKLNVSLIAIDEAHCISEWGHDFRPDYRHLKELRGVFPSVPVIALTATATPRVQSDIVEQLSMHEAEVFLSSFNRPNLHYAIRPKANAFGQLVQLLEPYKDKPVIVYCFSRKETEAIASDLTRAGFAALPYHAGLAREVRRGTQEKFIRDEVPIIVATIAFGMGIDKPDVRLVAHMGLPKTIEGYYQETGRAGRDGLDSECVLFYTFADKRKQEYFIGMIEDEAEQALARRKLTQVIDYCETHTCRRAFLLEYFAEASEDALCDNCDNCRAPERAEHDATEIAQKILSTVLRTQERFGAAYICDVLRGSKKERIVENKHDTLSVHGIARNIPVDDLRAYIRDLEKKGYLEKNDGEYPTLGVSSIGKAALVSGERILLPTLIPTSTNTSPARKPARGDLPFEAELFEELRALRKSIAENQNVPPFVIFGDRSLQEMSYYLPATSDQLAVIFGVGARKLAEYGETFLAPIRAYSDSKNLSPRPHPKSGAEPPSVRTGSTYEKTKELIEQKRTLQEIAAARGLAEGTIVQHVTTLLAGDQSLEIEHLRPAPDRLEVIRGAAEQAGTHFLTPIKSLLGEDYSYEEIKLALLFL